MSTHTFQRGSVIYRYYRCRSTANLGENSMRPVALGCKNWLHVGSAKAGPKVAVILSVVESCKRLRIPVKDYMLEVLTGMASRTMSAAARLTLGCWSPLTRGRPDAYSSKARPRAQT